ncbi:MAG: hypothetical protein EAZ58_11310, partial [Flavobacterium sp.]
MTKINLELFTDLDKYEMVEAGIRGGISVITHRHAKANNKFLNRICGRYKNAMYRSAEGFEVIAVAVQSDKKAWNEAITNDSLNNFIN